MTIRHIFRLIQEKQVRSAIHAEQRLAELEDHLNIDPIGFCERPELEAELDRLLAAKETTDG